MTPDLLTGPRGRRLCLHLACEASDDVRFLLHDLAYNADVAAGAAVVRFGWNEDGSTFETRGQVETSATTAALAGAIGEVGVFTPAAEDLYAAMLRAVDSARYWQEPDGDDIIAADAAVRASLEQIAATVVALPETTWWSRDRTAEQWAVEFDPSEDGAPFDEAPGGAQKWRESTAADEARARAERPSDVTANYSGTWWSHPWGCQHTTGDLPTGVPAGIPFVEDGFGWTHAVAIPVRGGGRTFEIRTADDWAELCRRFPIEGHGEPASRLVPRHRSRWSLVAARLDARRAGMGRRAPHGPGVPHSRDARDRSGCRVLERHRRLGPRRDLLAHRPRARGRGPARALAGA